MKITLYSTFLFNFYSFADSWQIGFQNPVIPYMEGLLIFIMFFVIIIFLIWLLFKLPNFENLTLFEIIWISFSIFVITIIFLSKN